MVCQWIARGNDGLKIRSIKLWWWWYSFVAVVVVVLDIGIILLTFTVRGVHHGRNIGNVLGPGRGCRQPNVSTTSSAAATAFAIHASTTAARLFEKWHGTNDTKVLDQSRDLLSLSCLGKLGDATARVGRSSRIAVAAANDVCTAVGARTTSLIANIIIVIR